MNKIVTLIMAFLMSLLSQAVTAQEYTHKLGNSAENAIEFSLSQSEISIEGYNGNEVIIKNPDYEAPPKRAEGLRPLYGSGQDNTGIGLSVEEETGQLKIVQASAQNGEYIVKVPNKVRIMIEEVNWGGGDIEISNHIGEIEIQSKSGDVNLKNITGPVIANSTSGNMDITFSDVSTATPTSISLVSGYIDVTMPASTKADLNLSSVSGEIYTNMDLSLKGNKQDMNRLGGGHEIKGTLNGGGVDIELKSVSGEIYLRKSESMGSEQ